MRHECPATVCISGCELMVCGCNFLFWMSDDGLGLTLKDGSMAFVCGLLASQLRVFI